MSDYRLELVWCKKKAQYSNGYFARLGKWHVGGYDWDSCRPKGDNTPPWAVSCALPGIKSRLSSHHDQTEAREELRRIIEHWLQQAGVDCAVVNVDAEEPKGVGR